ncbi:MAG: hypothetical protein ACTSPY_11170 [Candidatus Helarchaeota archaeon]
MAILGIFIQSKNGIPVYKEAWSSKIQALKEGDEILISGFMSAISQFANTFKQEIGYIRFLPQEFANDKGVDSILVNLNEFLAITFVDPYQFHDMVKIKLDWIYRRVLFGYKEYLSYGKTIKLTDEDEAFCWNIIHDQQVRKHIESKRNILIEKFDDFMNYNPDIRGLAINSFDNTILFNYGVERSHLEDLLYYMGSGITKVSEYEILHKPIIEENGESLLLCLTNPAISIELTDLLESEKEIKVPLYYYIITDPDSSIGPVIGSLIDTINPIFD